MPAIQGPWIAPVTGTPRPLTGPLGAWGKGSEMCRVLNLRDGISRSAQPLPQFTQRLGGLTNFWPTTVLDLGNRGIFVHNCRALKKLIALPEHEDDVSRYAHFQPHIFLRQISPCLVVERNHPHDFLKASCVSLGVSSGKPLAFPLHRRANYFMRMLQEPRPFLYCLHPPCVQVTISIGFTLDLSLTKAVSLAGVLPRAITNHPGSGGRSPIRKVALAKALEWKISTGGKTSGQECAKSKADIGRESSIAHGNRLVRISIHASPCSVRRILA